jgi:hypothetical protein
MIQEGLLWFDDDPGRAVTDKVSRAVQRYQQKYGHNPDVCYVHPGQVPERELSVGPVKVLPAQTVLPHHFWLGVTLDGKKGKHSGRRGQVL